MSLVSSVTGNTLFFARSQVPPCEGALSAQVSSATWNPTTRDVTLTMVGQQAATLVLHDIPQNDWLQLKSLGGF